MKRGPHAPTDNYPSADALPRRRKSAQQPDTGSAASPGLEAARVDELLRPNTVAPVLLRDARLALRESETQFRELIEQASDGIFLADAAGNYLLANPRLCEMLGYTETQLLASNVAISYPEVDWRRS